MDDKNTKTERVAAALNKSITSILRNFIILSDD